MTETIRLATRGSDLALRQAAAVAEQLESRRRSVNLVEVETRGDQVRDELIHRLGKTGAFVRTLDERVLSGDVDAAVHSLKDVPTDFPEGLVVAATPQRASPGDALVTPQRTALADLSEGAVVGTSSLRRRAQLLAAHPTLEVAQLRGNVDTRLEKLLAPTLQREHERRLSTEENGVDETEETGDTESDSEPEETREKPYSEDGQSVDEWFEGLSEIERRALGREVDREYDAIVLAQAGLERLGLLETIDCEQLSPTEFVPAPGQGSIAVTSREDDVGNRINEALDHPRTRVETTVERTILAELGGGCVAPVGVYAVLQGAQVHVVVRVLDREGDEEIQETRDLPAEAHGEAARRFATDLAEEGAADLVAQARRRADEQTAAKREEE